MRRVVPLILATLLAGCFEDDGAATDDPAAPDDPAPQGIAWSVSLQVDWWEDVATNYPKHDSNLPTNTMLRERIVDDMGALGFDVEVRAYSGQLQGQMVPATPATQVYAIIATKAGTTLPDHRIGLVSHYDSQTATIQGAYDDLSGVAAEYSICKAFAQVPLDRTLACIYFDAEERGLVASQRYVQDAILDGDEDYVYDIVLGYDMTGMNWPGYPTWKMYVMTGPEDDVPWLVPFAEGIMHDQLAYPTEGVEVLDVHDRNSDERRFKEAGVPILRFAGGRHAADYDQYHKPLDTVEHVYEVVGGRPNFETGFATIVESSYATILALDATGIEQMQAARLAPV